MAYAYTPKTRLDKLEFSPYSNPLAQLATVKTRNKMVRSGGAEWLSNVQTGEVTHASILHEVNQVDEEHFVKIFAAGVTAMFSLSRTAQKVFNLVLKRYQQSEMAGGYSDTVELFWFDNKLDGESIGITEQTFKKGLRELIDKQFLHARITHSYWINPNLFFKGDRVLFIREYRRESKTKTKQTGRKPTALEDRDPNTIDFINGKADAELVEVKP